jgi:hypothetical protein
MKIFKIGLIPVVFCCVVFFSSAPLSSCTKTKTITDTIKITVRDTIIKKDTVTIRDTSNCHNLVDGMVAYYNFNKGSLQDSSGKNNHIILNSGATKTADRFGKADNAYLFNGSSNFMQVKSSPTLSPTNITMMAIIKLNGFYKGDYRQNQILKKGFRDQSNGIYGLRVSPTTGDCCTIVDTTKEVTYGYYGDYGSTISVYDTTSYVRVNKWITQVVTFDGFQLKIYVDGVLKMTTIGSPSYTPNFDDLFIGRAENPTYPYWFNGVIDEIRIYNKVLCPEAIVQLSNLKQ